MLSSMKRVKITHVTVDPSACDAWSGVFIKNPSRADIIDAIRYDHSQLDPDIEHEYDRRDNLVLCLQLLDQVGVLIYGPIKIAGSYVGSITTNESEAFERVTSFECVSSLPRMEAVDSLKTTTEVADPLDFDPIVAEITGVKSCSCGEVDLSNMDCHGKMPKQPMKVKNPCGEIQGEVSCGQVAAGSVTEVRDVEMEQRCVEAHEAGESRPLQEFIDALQAESEGFGDQFFNVLKNTIWDPKV